MDLKKLFQNDDSRAVSPVIGVILMVAITVILAAVIGAFVLDLGATPDDPAPQAQLSLAFDETNDEIELSHNGGDNVNLENVRVTVDGTTEIEEGGLSGVLSAGETENIDTGTDITEGQSVAVVWGPDGTILTDSDAPGAVSQA